MPNGWNSRFQTKSFTNNISYKICNPKFLQHSWIEREPQVICWGNELPLQKLKFQLVTSLLSYQQTEVTMKIIAFKDECRISHGAFNFRVHPSRHRYPFKINPEGQGYQLRHQLLSCHYPPQRLEWQEVVRCSIGCIPPAVIARNEWINFYAHFIQGNAIMEYTMKTMIEKGKGVPFPHFFCIMLTWFFVAKHLTFKKISLKRCTSWRLPILVKT